MGDGSEVDDEGAYIRPLTVMHVIARMNTGGPAVEILELMRGLPESDFHQCLVTGFCASDETDHLDAVDATGLEVIRVSRLGRSIRPWDDLRAWFEVRREIRRLRPDIVHSHTAKAGLIARSAARASGVPCAVVHTHHGHLLYGYFGRVKTWVVIALERFLSRMTDHLIAVGQRVRDDLLAAGIGRRHAFTVVHSGVSLGALPLRSVARSELGIPEDAVVALFMGRLTGIKRVDRLLDVSDVLRDESDLLFVIAGGGSEQEALEEEVSRRGLPVAVLGWRHDRERLLAAADVMVLTSDNEGVPLVLLESALAGLPAVATDVGSVREVILPGTTGFLCAPDPKELAARVREIVREPEKARHMGLAARSLVLERFSPARFLDGHAAVYRQAAQERKSGGRVTKTPASRGR